MGSVPKKVQEHSPGLSISGVSRLDDLKSDLSALYRRVDGRHRPYIFRQSVSNLLTHSDDGVGQVLDGDGQRQPRFVKLPGRGQLRGLLQGVASLGKPKVLHL